MKTILALTAAVSLSCCDTFKNYSPMLSLGVEVGDSKITVGVAPVPIVRQEDPPEVLPPVEVIDSK